MQFGGLEDALSLLALADASARNELDRAKVALFRGRMAFLAGDGSDALKLLLQAAKRFEPLDAGLARETYLEAINAACFAGSLLDGVDLKGVGLAAKTAPPSLKPARPSELLLDGLALLATEGPAAAAPTLRRAGSAFRNQESSAEEDLRWLRQASATASLLWDNESWFAMSSRWVQVARDSGALTLLSQSLNSMANIHLFGGDLRLSAALIAEAEAINDVTGSNLAPYCAASAALRGRELEARALIEASTKEATAGGQGMVVAFAQWATATLYNGLARYDKALVAAQQASEHPLDWRSHLSLHELIEAAVRNGTPSAWGRCARAAFTDDHRQRQQLGNGDRSPGRGRCSMKAERQTLSTSRLLPASDPLDWLRRWPALTFSMASGYAASGRTLDHANGSRRL